MPRRVANWPARAWWDLPLARQRILQQGDSRLKLVSRPKALSLLALFGAAIRDSISDRTRLRISLKEVSQFCNEISEKAAMNFNPDVVVAIARGGIKPGELIAIALHLPLFHITVSRMISKKKYNHWPRPAKWLRSLYDHYLFNSRPPILISGIESDIRMKRVLVVDDAVHSGATMDLVVAYLRRMGATDVRFAALSHVFQRKADFSILPKGNYCYPWSEDY